MKRIVVILVGLSLFGVACGKESEDKLQTEECKRSVKAVDKYLQLISDPKIRLDFDPNYFNNLMKQEFEACGLGKYEPVQF